MARHGREPAIRGGITTSTLIDYRKPETRVDLFQKFYSWALKYRSHPGCVYYVLPYLAEALGWTGEQRAWAAWINGNTQNPVTTLMLMEAGDRPERADAMLNWFLDHREALAWDTDRRYHRKAFPAATLAYLDATRGSGVRYWRAAAARGWPGCWDAARQLPTMGRLSAWSYLEYLRILDVGIPDADTLLLSDLAGSRSHRNGLALVMGREDLMWWRFNPAGGQHLYTPCVVGDLADFGQALLTQAWRHNRGNLDVGYLTLESALCTFKSWHVPDRRYTNVYNDMLYDRLKLAESRHGHRFDLIWEARARSLPGIYLMEETLNDPGCVPVKQNHFLETGNPPMLGYEYPEIGLSEFDHMMPTGAYNKHRRWQ